MEDVGTWQSCWALVVSCQPNVCLSLQSTIPRISGSVVPSSHKHKCSQCHRSYASLHGLRMHEAIHSGHYPYWCKICGKGFPATSNLRGHMAQHTGIAEFKCDVCGRQYRYQCDYKRHLKQHSTWTRLAGQVDTVLIVWTKMNEQLKC